MSEKEIAFLKCMANYDVELEPGPERLDTGRWGQSLAYQSLKTTAQMLKMENMTQQLKELGKCLQTEYKAFSKVDYAPLEEITWEQAEKAKQQLKSYTEYTKERQGWYGLESDHQMFMDEAHYMPPAVPKHKPNERRPKQVEVYAEYGGGSTYRYICAHCGRIFPSAKYQEDFRFPTHANYMGNHNKDCVGSGMPLERAIINCHCCKGAVVGSLVDGCKNINIDYHKDSHSGHTCVGSDTYQPFYFTSQPVKMQ